MTDAPKTIWATGRAEQGGSWNATPINGRVAPPQTEYIRKDISDARIAELEAALKLWLKYDQCENINSVDLMLDYNAALEATRKAMRDATE